MEETINLIIEEIEIWKPVPIANYSEFYLISNFGNIRSIYKNSIKPLKINKLKNNYCLVKLYVKGVPLSVYIHRLVAKVFINNPNNYEIIDHIDKNPSNNHYTNLRWCTTQMNVKYSWENEARVSPTKGKFGKNHPSSKTVLQYDLQGNFIKEWESATIIENSLGMLKVCISNCCRGKRKTAYGFIWKFKD